MKPNPPRSGLSRRTLLSILTAFPALSGILLPAAAQAQATTSGNPLPSWNDGATKQSILDFVAATREGSPDFILPAERIVTFHNDETSGSSIRCTRSSHWRHPRSGKALAPQHPNGRTHNLSRRARSDMRALAASGERGLVALVMATHAGMTTAEFQKIVPDWFSSARDPKFETALYRTRLLADGRAALVTSRERLQDLYRFRRRYRVHATLDRTRLRRAAGAGHRFVDQDEVRDARRQARALPAAGVNFVDDKSGKPVGINEHIGRRPIATFGNSDGDLEMLQWTTMANGRGLV